MFAPCNLMAVEKRFRCTLLLCKDRGVVYLVGLGVAMWYSLQIVVVVLCRVVLFFVGYSTNGCVRVVD